MNEKNELALNPDEYLVSFEFAALDYSQPEKNQYKYKLEGFDPDWVETGTRNRATFTNIPSGEYTLKVLGSNNDGVWSKEPASINIVVHPPVWKTWWAYTSYILILTGLTYLFLWLFYRRKMAEKDNLSLKVIAAEKDKLLANISHEFRTPLTLILGPTKSLIKDSRNKEQIEQLKLIERNSLHLLSMIEQMLELSRLNELERDLNYFINVSEVSTQIAASFDSLFMEKKASL